MELLLVGDLLLDEPCHVVGPGAAVGGGGVGGGWLGGLFVVGVSVLMGIGIAVFLPEHSNGQLGNNSSI